MKPEHAASAVNDASSDAAGTGVSRVESAYQTMRQRILDNVWSPGYARWSRKSLSNSA